MLPAAGSRVKGLRSRGRARLAACGESAVPQRMGTFTIGNCQGVDAVTPWARRLTPAALFAEKSGKSRGLTVPFFGPHPLLQRAASGLSFPSRPDQATQAVDADAYPKVHDQPPVEGERFVPRAARKIIHQPVVDGVADQDADERAPETAGPTKAHLLLHGEIHNVGGEPCGLTSA